MAKVAASQIRDAVQQEQSYPLISMVQLVTFCVALVTCVDFKKLSDVLEGVQATVVPQTVLLVIAAGILGFVLGAAIGLGQIRKWRSMFLCGAAGAIVTLLILATYAAPAKPVQAAAASLLPIVSTLIIRSRTA